MTEARAPAVLSFALVGWLAACRAGRDQAPPEPAAPPDTVEVSSAAVDIDPPAAPGALAPNLHATAAAIYASWLEPRGTGGHRLRVARWDGRAWSAPATITEGDRIVANWADVPSVGTAADGAVVAHWAEKSGAEPYAYDAVVARSTDSGATWSRLGPVHGDRTPAEHGFVSLVADEGGVRAFWLDGRAAAGGAGTALRSALVGAAIGADELVDERVCDCCGTAAAPAAGGPVIFYRDRSADEVRDIAAAARAAPGWTRRGSVHDDGWKIAGCPVNGPAAAARADHLAVAWYTYADSIARVRVAFSKDGGATFGAPVEVDGPQRARAPIGRVGVVLDDDGSAIVSWAASAREEAFVLLRRVTAAGEGDGELAVAVTKAARDSGFPRVARLGGDVVVAWTEPASPSRLRAVRVPIAAVPRGGRAAGRAPAEPLARVGVAAPALEATTLDGAPASLAALRGRPVLVNVWATWCEPCRHGFPELALLHARHRDRGLEVVAISVDRERTRTEVAAFAARRELSFPIWHDGADRVMSALGAGPLPINLLIGRDGTILWRRDGAVRADDDVLLVALEAALRTHH